MSDTETLAILRLQRIPNIGSVTAKKLITACGSPSAIFLDKREHLLKIEGIGRWSIAGLWNPEYMKAATAELEFIKKNKIRLLYYKDTGYPGLLKNCADGPVLLFANGKMDLEGKRIVSIVGTRDMTRFGKECCELFIKELAPYDPVIVSGMAFGVDICAQRMAMELGLQTIGCLGHGLNRTYPSPHARDAKRMQAHGGCLTEFWSTTRPDREHFLQRNRIIAGMSHATVVIESAARGGSLVTADLAFGYNREVFAIPGRPTDIYSEGCNGLIRNQKAQLITSAADLIYFMDWGGDPDNTKEKQHSLFVPLGAEEEDVHDYLHSSGRQHIDTIAIKCGLSVHKLASILLTMEMKGVVRPLPGKYFEAC